jgi:hypothetical protein
MTVNDLKKIISNFCDESDSCSDCPFTFTVELLAALIAPLRSSLVS